MPKISDFRSQDASKMEPKWSQNVTQICKKAILKQEAKKANENEEKAFILEALVLQKCRKLRVETLGCAFSAFSQKINSRAPKIIKRGTKMEPKWWPRANKID